MLIDLIFAFQIQFSLWNFNLNSKLIVERHFLAKWFLLIHMRSCSNIEWKSSNNSWKMVEGFWNDSKWDKNWNMPFLQIRSSPSRLENKQCDPKKPIINECTWGSFWFKNAVGMSGCTRDPKSKEALHAIRLIWRYFRTDELLNLITLGRAPWPCGLSRQP